MKKKELNLNELDFDNIIHSTIDSEYEDLYEDKILKIYEDAAKLKENYGMYTEITPYMDQQNLDSKLPVVLGAEYNIENLNNLLTSDLYSEDFINNHIKIFNDSANTDIESIMGFLRERYEYKSVPKDGESILKRWSQVYEDLYKWIWSPILDELFSNESQLNEYKENFFKDKRSFEDIASFDTRINVAETYMKIRDYVKQFDNIMLYLIKNYDYIDKIRYNKNLEQVVYKGRELVIVKGEDNVIEIGLKTEVDLASLLNDMIWWINRLGEDNDFFKSYNYNLNIMENFVSVSSLRTGYNFYLYYLESLMKYKDSRNKLYIFRDLLSVLYKGFINEKRTCIYEYIKDKFNVGIHVNNIKPLNGDKDRKIYTLIKGVGLDQNRILIESVKIIQNKLIKSQNVNKPDNVFECNQYIRFSDNKLFSKSQLYKSKTYTKLNRDKNMNGFVLEFILDNGKFKSEGLISENNGFELDIFDPIKDIISKKGNKSLENIFGLDYYGHVINLALNLLDGLDEIVIDKVLGVYTDKDNRMKSCMMECAAKSPIELKLHIDKTQKSINIPEYFLKDDYIGLMYRINNLKPEEISNCGLGGESFGENPFESISKVGDVIDFNSMKNPFEIGKDKDEKPDKKSNKKNIDENIQLSWE